MRLYLIRHGESLWNAQDRIQGHGDSPLSDAGRQQAAHLARHLSRASIGAIYASRLLRARQTAEIIGGAIRVAVDVRPDLHEIGLGAWEGKTPAEVNAHFANGFDAWRKRPTSVHIPDSEPIADFRRRAVTAIDAASANQDDCARGRFMPVDASMRARRPGSAASRGSRSRSNRCKGPLRVYSAASAESAAIRCSMASALAGSSSPSK